MKGNFKRYATKLTKEYLEYSQWKNIYDKIVDNIFRGGDYPPKDENGYINEHTLCISKRSKEDMRKALANPQALGRSSVLEICKDFCVALPFYNGYLYSVEYDCWTEQLLFKTVKLIGENATGYVFDDIYAGEFFSVYSMYGATKALLFTRDGSSALV